MVISCGGWVGSPACQLRSCGWSGRSGQLSSVQSWHHSSPILLGCLCVNRSTPTIKVSVWFSIFDFIEDIHIHCLISSPDSQLTLSTRRSHQDAFHIACRLPPCPCHGAGAGASGRPCPGMVQQGQGVRANRRSGRSHGEDGREGHREARHAGDHVELAVHLDPGLQGAGLAHLCYRWSENLLRPL